MDTQESDVMAASVTPDDDKTQAGVLSYNEPKFGYLEIKRILDIFGSLLGLIVLFVPMLLVALIILIDSPGASPIYAQERVGKDGRRFQIYKFRSMIPNAEKQLHTLLDKNEMDGPAFKIKDDPRITRFGRFIRRSSIDELPQLWNVLKGEMSMVGPRPPLPREVEQYTPEHLQKLSIKPGITCYWQVQPQRNNLSFEEWMALDMKYISERSLKTDIGIFFRTFRAVWGLEGE